MLAELGMLEEEASNLTKSKKPKKRKLVTEKLGKLSSTKGTLISKKKKLLGRKTSSDGGIEMKITPHQARSKPGLTRKPISQRLGAVNRSVKSRLGGPVKADVEGRKTE